MKKYPLIGISLIAIVLFVLSSSDNAVGYQMVQSPICTTGLTIDFITYKPKFPRIYLDNSFFNATVIVTNRGVNTFENLHMHVSLYQAHPRPREPLGYNEHVYNLSFEPSESYKFNFSCKPDMIPKYLFALFSFETWIYYGTDLVAHKFKWYLIYQPLSQE
jgi:hypothetical protein